MSVRGKWHVVETPEYDMAGPGSFILFAEDGGEFALDCLTGAIHGRCEGDAVEFTWTAAMRRSPQGAMVGQRSWMTARSKVKSALKVETIFPLSRADPPLLQQPAST